MAIDGPKKAYLIDATDLERIRRAANLLNDIEPGLANALHCIAGIELLRK